MDEERCFLSNMTDLSCLPGLMVLLNAPDRRENPFCFQHPFSKANVYGKEPDQAQKIFDYKQFSTSKKNFVFVIEAQLTKAIRK